MISASAVDSPASRGTVRIRRPGWTAARGGRPARAAAASMSATVTVTPQNRAGTLPGASATSTISGPKRTNAIGAGQLGRAAAPAHVAAGGGERAGGPVAVVGEGDDVVDRERAVRCAAAVAARRRRRRTQRQPVGVAPPRAPVELSATIPSPAARPAEPHARAARARSRPSASGAKPSARPGGGIVGDHELAGGGHRAAESATLARPTPTPTAGRAITPAARAEPGEEATSPLRAPRAARAVPRLAARSASPSPSSRSAASSGGRSARSRRSSPTRPASGPRSPAPSRSTRSRRSSAASAGTSLLRAEGGTPSRADAQGLNVVGYAANNVLPARAGDAVRVFLMAPRAATSKKAVLGTLLAERLLDIAVILTLFVVVGYGLLGEVGAGELGLDRARHRRRVAAAARSPSCSSAATSACTRSPRRSSPPRCSCAGATGSRCSASRSLIWALEAGVWMSAGAAAGFPMDPIEGCYIVALASVFALIPSGPGYAGTQDAAAITGILALGGTALAGRHLPDPRALRDRGPDHGRRARADGRRATAACGRLRARPMRRRGWEVARLRRARRGRAGRAPDRARRPPVPPRREPGRLLLVAVPDPGRLRPTSRSCTARCAST